MLAGQVGAVGPGVGTLSVHVPHGAPEEEDLYFVHGSGAAATRLLSGFVSFG